MSERIFVHSNFLNSGNQPQNMGTQSNADIDIRYSGIVDKPRFHPRLLIRKFRNTALLSSTAVESTPIIELNNFILTEADEEVEEKFQIVQTFGPDFVFFYGPRPRILSYSGVLYNTSEKPWATEWQRAWDTAAPNQTGFPFSGDDPTQEQIKGSQDTQRSILSGTNVVLQGGIARLEYDGCYGAAQGDTTIDPVPFGGTTINTNPNNVLLVREGYILKFAIRRRGDSPNAATFNLSMLITNRLDF
jgi:hypothetical protein